jgi:hypothetical protein
MPLGLKRQPLDDTEDEIRDEPLPEPSDLITGEDALLEELDDENEGDGGLFPRVPGLMIAAATFVPTFLAVVFGLSYLLGGASQTAHTASAPVRPTTKLDLGAPVTPPVAENAPSRTIDPSAPPPAPTLPPAQPQVGLPPAPEPRAARPAEPPSAPSPALPPAQPRVAIPPASEPRAARPVEPPRQPQAAVLSTPERTPTAEPRRSGSDWTPAAAFADREAAGRLASSIQQQGYPVEIRQEQSSARPWVVWIGAQPRGGERRR